LLAPTGVLRAGINLSNILLVTGEIEAGDPVGVAPDMASEIATCLGTDLELVPFGNPDEVCDAAASGAWDIALVGADPDRAQLIDFSSAYVEIQATYMVPVDSKFTSIEQVDCEGTRIATKGGGAYDLWLTRNLHHAELLRAASLDASYDLFHDQKLEALSGLRSKLAADLHKHPGCYKVLDGKFMAVQQAIGCLKSDSNEAATEFLQRFVKDAKASGLVQRLIDKHGVGNGLSVAPVSG